MLPCQVLERSWDDSDLKIVPAFISLIFRVRMKMAKVWLGLGVLMLLFPAESLAQKRIPKAAGYDQCPLGYVNTLKTTCVSPVYYEMRLTNGQPCDSGWMNVGAGYCRKK